MPFVLDSYALLAHLEDEGGAARVREVRRACREEREQGYVSTINVGETAYITERERGSPEAARVLGIIDRLPLVQVAASKPRILAAAHIKAGVPISYADAFAVAAAEEFSAVILTGDPEFRLVEERVVVEWLPR